MGSGAPPERKPWKEWVVDHLDRIGVGVVIAVIAIALGSIFGLPGSGGGGSSAVQAGVTTNGGSSETAAAEGNTPAPAPSTVVEYADNLHGSPVFADPKGKSVAGSLPGAIPYETKVEVDCYVENHSELESVNAFYLIAAGRWKGDYVVANTMTNGGAIGDETSPELDSRVRRCGSGG
jgi:hypothetical protein